MPNIMTPKTSQMTVSQDGLDVVIIKDGARYVSLPWDAALLLADAIKIKARQIEEQVKASAIAIDQAFVLRKGLPFGLTSNPQIVRESYKEAAHNRELRKHIPFVSEGIRSREAMGTPSLIKHKPGRKSHGTERNDG